MFGLHWVDKIILFTAARRSELNRVSAASCVIQVLKN